MSTLIGPGLHSSTYKSHIVPASPPPRISHFHPPSSHVHPPSHPSKLRRLIYTPKLSLSLSTIHSRFLPSLGNTCALMASSLAHHSVARHHPAAEPCRQRTAASYHNAIPGFPPAIDMLPVTRRTRRPRPTTADTAQPGNRTRRRVYFVPDPPTWAPTTGASAKPAKHVSSQPGRSPERGHQSRCTPSHVPEVLQSPPPTPRIPRLRTPDIKPVEGCTPFCSCCPAVDSGKMEMQCKSSLPCS